MRNRPIQDNPIYVKTCILKGEAQNLKGEGNGLFFNTQRLQLVRFKDQEVLLPCDGEKLHGHIIRTEHGDYTNPESYMEKMDDKGKSVLTRELAKCGLPMSVIENRFEAQKSKADRPARRIKLRGVFAKTY